MNRYALLFLLLLASPIFAADLLDVLPTFSKNNGGNVGLRNSELPSQFNLIRNSTCVSSPNFFHVGIRQTGSVSRATSLPTLSGFVSHVVGIGSEKKMNRVDAGRIVAPMQNRKSVGNWANQKSVGNSVSKNKGVTRPAGASNAVAMNVKQSFPKDTSSFSLFADAIKKPLVQRDCQPFVSASVRTEFSTSAMNDIVGDFKRLSAGQTVSNYIGSAWNRMTWHPETPRLRDARGGVLQHDRSTILASLHEEAKDDPTTPPAIILPDISPPIPPPSPPSGTTKIGSQQMYVIRSETPLIVLSFPQSLATITNETGPLRIRGSFVGGNGKTETKNFKEKYLVIVEAAAIGKGELAIWNSGVTDSKQVIRRMVDCQTAPIPPPDPVPPIPVPPDPNPPVPPTPTDPFQAALQAAYTADTDTDKAASVAELAAIYKAAALLVPGKGFQTVQGVVSWIKGSETITATAIPSTRKTIGAELNKVLPTDPAAVLDATTRDLLAKEFNKVATAIGGLK